MNYLIQTVSKSFIRETRFTKRGELVHISITQE
jgi:hypothetical protein